MTVQSRNTGLLPIARDSGIHRNAPMPMSNVGVINSMLTSTFSYNYYRLVNHGHSDCDSSACGVKGKKCVYYLLHKLLLQCLKHQTRRLHNSDSNNSEDKNSCKSTEAFCCAPVQWISSVSRWNRQAKYAPVSADKINTAWKIAGSILWRCRWCRCWLSFLYRRHFRKAFRRHCCWYSSIALQALLVRSEWRSMYPKCEHHIFILPIDLLNPSDA